MIAGLSSVQNRLATIEIHIGTLMTDITNVLVTAVSLTDAVTEYSVNTIAPCCFTIGDAGHGIINTAIHISCLISCFASSCANDC